MEKNKTNPDIWKAWIVVGRCRLCNSPIYALATQQYVDHLDGIRIDSFFLGDSPPESRFSCKCNLGDPK